MIKIADAFQNGKAFIPFVTCGDPDLETTASLVKAMAQAGADLIELGIPSPTPPPRVRSSRAPISGRSLPAPPPTRCSSWSRNCGRVWLYPWYS